MGNVDICEEDLKPAQPPQPAKTNRFNFVTLAASPDEEVRALRKELKERKKESVTTARAIVHLEDEPLMILMRRGEGGKFGFVGGKIEANSSAQETIVQEVIEELGIRDVSSLRPLTVIKTPNAETSFLRKKWEALGFSSEGYEIVRRGKPSKSEKKKSSGKKAKSKEKTPRGSDRIMVPNRRTRFFTLTAREEPTSDRVEKRDVVVLDLSDESSLKMIKPSQREIARVWRSHILDGTAIPDVIHDKK